MRRAAVLLLAALLLAGLAAPALARRKPTAAEDKAVRAAVTAFFAKSGPSARSSKITGVSISTVNRRWAIVRSNSKADGVARTLVHRPRNAWKAVVTASGPFNCDAAPDLVMQDLAGRCY